jgi:predicted nuclease of predicted toxin-antitoxin system
LLLDQGLPRSLASLLRQEGYDAVHVGEKQLATASDASIIEYAKESDRAVITHDADFHTLIALSHAAKPSAIRIRIEGLRAPQLFSLIELLMDTYGSEIEQGAIMSVTEARVRVRMLPIT